MLHAVEESRERLQAEGSRCLGSASHTAVTWHDVTFTVRALRDFSGECLLYLRVFDAKGSDLSEGQSGVAGKKVP